MTTPRAFALLVAVASIFIDIGAEAQPTGNVARVGFLSPIGATSPGQAVLLAALREELKRLGYAEGRNVILERRYAESRPERLPDLARELVGARMDVIVTVGSQASRAAKAVTSSIPIVMVGVADPVEIGLVSSLAHPGGNVTGLSFNTGQQLYAKHLEVLKEIVPGLAIAGVVIDPRSPVYATSRRELDVAAQSLGLTLLIHQVREPGDVERAFAEMPGQGAAGVFVVPNPFVYAQRRQILALAARQRLPGIYGFREFVDDGGLAYYGADLPAMWRRAAVFVDRILKGARPPALPVEQPTKFELVLNVRTARSLGLELPAGLLLRADHLIE